ncbi:hypothetical protein RUND412_001341 [Rhizina undulata]
MNPISLPCQEPSFPANPDWKLQLQEDLSKQPVNFFSLATVSEALTPRVRTLTLSGFLGESDYKSTTKIPSEGQNPPASSDVIFITSDARQNKFRDLEVSLSVEAAFWIPSVGAQWRIKGRGVSIGGTGEQEMKTRTELEQHLTIEGDGASWTWEKEIAKQYELLYFGHKAKFQSTEDPETGISTEFRILGIIPEDVEVYRQKPTETWVNWKVEEGEPHAKWVSKEGK